MVDPTLVVFQNILVLPDLPGLADNPFYAGPVFVHIIGYVLIGKL